MHAKQDDKVEMEFVYATYGDYYLTENKTAGFLAEIQSGVTVSKMSSAIQAWKKTGSGTTSNTGTTYSNKMTFGEEVDFDLNLAESSPLELVKSKSIISKNQQATLHMQSTIV